MYFFCTLAFGGGNRRSVNFQSTRPIRALCGWEGTRYQQRKKGHFLRERRLRRETPPNCPFGQQWALSLFFPPFGILLGSHFHRPTESYRWFSVSLTPSTAGSPGFCGSSLTFSILLSASISRSILEIFGFPFPSLPHP